MAQIAQQARRKTGKMTNKIDILRRNRQIVKRNRQFMYFLCFFCKKTL